METLIYFYRQSNPALMFFKFFTVAALASFEVYAAIPAGLAFELSFLSIFLSTTTGGIAGVVIAAFLGDRIRRLIAKYRKPKVIEAEKPKTGLIYRIWKKYGIVGLGLLGTITVGAPISIAVGVGFKAPMKLLVLWCCVGVVARCAMFTALGYYGMKIV